MKKIGTFLPVSLATMVILGAISLAASASDPATTTPGSASASVSDTSHISGAAVQAALEANDYDAWVKAISINGQLPEFLKVITKDNFAKLVSMHKLLKEGKKDEAKTIADELGLNIGVGEGGFGRPKINEAAETAITNGDYDAWVKAESVNGQLPEFLKVVTKDNFPKFVEARNYQKQAMELMKKSDALMKEIGFKRGPGFEKGEGHRGGRGIFREGPKDDRTETEAE